jgi:hypothetical protein
VEILKVLRSSWRRSDQARLGLIFNFRVEHSVEGKKLNEIMEVPTVENICQWILKKVPLYDSAKVEYVRVWETENRFAEAPSI